MLTFYRLQQKTWRWSVHSDHITQRDPHLLHSFCLQKRLECYVYCLLWRQPACRCKKKCLKNVCKYDLIAHCTFSQCWLCTYIILVGNVHSLMYVDRDFFVKYIINFKILCVYVYLWDRERLYDAFIYIYTKNVMKLLFKYLFYLIYFIKIRWKHIYIIFLMDPDTNDSDLFTVVFLSGR